MLLQLQDYNLAEWTTPSRCSCLHTTLPYPMPTLTHVDATHCTLSTLALNSSAGK
jgi:hypothetical protein